MNIRPIHKMVKERRPHCPQCKERLWGNNSMITPYHCSCGVWKPVMGTTEFTIEEKQDE